MEAVRTEGSHRQPQRYTGSLLSGKGGDDDLVALLDAEFLASLPGVDVLSVQAHFFVDDPAPAATERDQMMAELDAQFLAPCDSGVTTSRDPSHRAEEQPADTKAAEALEGCFDAATSEQTVQANAATDRRLVHMQAPHHSDMCCCEVSAHVTHAGQGVVL